MLLALDTATSTIGIGLDDGAKVISEHIWRSAGYHTVELAPEVALLLRRAGISVDQLTALAVASGPGSYTGLRIGMALAKGLAMARSLPMIGVPTLDILAHAQPEREEPMLAVLKAGRGRIAAVWYKWGRKGWQGQKGPESLTWEEALAQLDKPTYICGELDAVVRRTLQGQANVILASAAQSLRRPSFLADLARQKMKNKASSDPADLVPTYLGDIGGSEA